MTPPHHKRSLGSAVNRRPDPTVADGSGRSIPTSRGPGRLLTAPTPLPVGLDEGTGEPLVLLPGYGTRPDTYQPVVRLLAKRCRVVLVDIYAIRGPWHYHDVLQSFTATLDRLELERASFLAHSFGGGIELGFAVRHPERVVDLIFSDTLALCHEWALAREAMSHPLRMLGMATPRAAIDFVRSWVTHPRQLVDAAWWGFTSGRSSDIHLVAEAGISAHVLWANRDSLLSRRDGQDFARDLHASFLVCDAPGYVDHDWMYRHPGLFVGHLDRLGLAVFRGSHASSGESTRSPRVASRAESLQSS
jgi:pimeloyl-ACP methyl ester carboxylesterase